MQKRSLPAILTIVLLSLTSACASATPIPSPTLPPTATREPSKVPSVEPSQTPTVPATSTPEPMDPPEIAGDAHGSLVTVYVESGQGTAQREGVQLEGSSLDELITQLAKANYKDEEQIEVYLGEGTSSSDLVVLQETEKEGGKKDILGELTEAPQTLSLANEDEGQVTEYSLIADQSDTGFAVYQDTEGNRIVLPLQFSLIGEKIADKKLVGAVPYTIQGENGLRIAYLFRNSEGEIEYLLDHYGMKFPVMETNSLFEGERASHNQENRLVVANANAETTQIYNPDRGEWELVVQQKELAGRKVDWIDSVEVNVPQVGNLRLDLGVDFAEARYERIPLQENGMEVNNPEQVAQIILGKHYRQWLISRAVEWTGGVEYWRNRYKTAEGEWTKASVQDMQRLVQNIIRAGQQNSYDEFLQLVENGGGQYQTFARGENGYDFYQVDPRKGLVSIYAEETSSLDGIRYKHTASDDYIFGVRVKDGRLICIFHEGFLFKQCMDPESGLPNTFERKVIQNSEIQRRYTEEELERIREVYLQELPGLVLLGKLERVNIGPTFTPTSLRGDALQVYPAGRLYADLFSSERIGGHGFMSPPESPFNTALHTAITKLYHDPETELSSAFSFDLANQY